MDLINRRDAIEHIKKRLYESAENNIGLICMAEHVFTEIADNRINTWIEELSSARKAGRWIQWNEPGCEHTECSVCKTEYDQIDLYIGGSEYPNYCPNCGAKMEEREQE